MHYWLVGSLIRRTSLTGAGLAIVLAAGGCAGGPRAARPPAAPSTAVPSTAVPSTAVPSTAVPSTAASARASQGPHVAALVRVHDPGRVTGTLAGPCHARDHGLLPDPRCTPGAIDPAVTQADIASTICAPGYTTRVRPPESQTEAFKFGQAYPGYGLAPGTQSELDHLVPLELGGANDAANLWPEAGPIPNPKDGVEDALHRAVCDGQVSLASAQRAIASDWETAEHRLGIGPVIRPPAPSPAPSPTRSPSSALSCTASVSTASPPDYSTVDVIVATSPGAAVSTVAHYKTTDNHKTATAGGSGQATIGYYISGATPGYTVTVSVTVASGGRAARCATSFTPRG